MMPTEGAAASAPPDPPHSPDHHQQNRRATAAVDGATGRKYCGTCSRFQPLDGGREIRVSHGRRVIWKCRWCVAAAAASRLRAIVNRSVVIDT